MYLLPGKIDIGDSGYADMYIRPSLKHLSEREGNRAWLEAGRSYLVEKPMMMILLSAMSGMFYNK